MKKFLLSAVLCCAVITAATAQDFVKNDFLSGYTVGENLEKNIYSTGDAVVLDTWSLIGKTDTNPAKLDNRGGVSPIVVSSTLSYSGYAGGDNNLAIQLSKITLPDGVTQAARFSVYSLAGTSLYKEGAYYSAFLVKMTLRGASNGADFFMFDGNYLGGNARGKIFVKPGTETNTIAFGINSTNSSVPTENTGDYDIDNVHLIVLKYDFTNKKVSLFVNPTITEEEATPTISVDIPDTDLLSSIRAIDIRQRTTTEMLIGGIRFSNNWADAVGYDNGTSINNETTDKGNVVSVKYYNLSGIEVNEPVNINSVYIKKAVYENGSVETTKIVK